MHCTVLHCHQSTVYMDSSDSSRCVLPVSASMWRTVWLSRLASGASCRVHSASASPRTQSGMMGTANTRQYTSSSALSHVTRGFVSFTLTPFPFSCILFHSEAIHLPTFRSPSIHICIHTCPYQHSAAHTLSVHFDAILPLPFIHLHLYSQLF